MPRKNFFKSHEDYLIWYRNYRKNNKQKIKEIVQRARKKNGNPWDKRNKLAIAAQDIVQHAIKHNLLKKLPCEICQTTINIHGHHDDYYQPLAVMWLCGVHHRARHKFLSNIPGLK